VTDGCSSSPEQGASASPSAEAASRSDGGIAPQLLTDPPAHDTDIADVILDIIGLDPRGAGRGQVLADVLAAGRYVMLRYTGHPDGLLGATASLLAWADAQDLT
jgi:hypothetical protein